MSYERVIWRGVAWEVQIVRDGGPGLSSAPRVDWIEAQEIVDPVAWWSFSEAEPCQWLSCATAEHCAELVALAFAAYAADVPDYG